MAQPASADASGSGSAGGCQHNGAALLAVLLEHPAVGDDQAVLCRLLATSKQAAALAASRCAGRLDARMGLTSEEQAGAAGAWLGRNARLLRSLRVWFCSGLFRRYCVTEATEALASGLRQAEQQAPGSLSRLRSFGCRGGFTGEDPMLEALWPASGALTRLELRGNVEAQAFDGDAITHLTGLRHLELLLDWDLLVNSGAVVGLVHLTHLDCRYSGFDPPDLPWLPALEHLVLPEAESLHCVGHDLGHLTSLTELTMWDDITRRVELPLSLVKLNVRYLRSIKLLLGLTALRRLQCGGVMYKEGLVELARRLRRLPWLDDVCLRELHGDSVKVLKACASTPIRGLFELNLGPEPAAVLKRLSRLTGLTGLALVTGVRTGGGPGAEAGPLAAALRALPQLRELNLGPATPPPSLIKGICFGSGHDDGAAAARGIYRQAHLMRTVVRLRELRFFTCWLDVSSDALAELAAATQLTGLILHACGIEVSDASLAPVLASLTGLERLELPCVSENSRITEASVELLCGLRHLTKLKAEAIDICHHATRRLWASLPRLVELIV